jgi:hypothetical protein
MNTLIPTVKKKYSRKKNTLIPKTKMLSLPR